jgi:hypothetical protein
MIIGTKLKGWCRLVPSLKENNRKKLVLFAVLQFAAFAWLLNGGIHEFSWETAAKALLTSAVANGAIAIAQILLSGLITDEVKASLIFWKIKHPLPGTQAFSRIAETDPRIDLNGLKTRYGPLPTEPREQNLLWYRIYRTHKDEAAVLDAHTDFLLTREMALMSVAFFIVLPLLGLASGIPRIQVALYAAALFAAYILCAVSGQHYGRRLVANVLAIEGAK